MYIKKQLSRMAKKLLVILRKNLIPVLIVLAVVGLVLYITQRKEGFGTSCGPITKPAKNGNCRYLNDSNYRIKNGNCVKEHGTLQNCPRGYQLKASGKCHKCDENFNLSDVSPYRCNVRTDIPALISDIDILTNRCRRGYRPISGKCYKCPTDFYLPEYSPDSQNLCQYNSLDLSDMPSEVRNRVCA